MSDDGYETSDPLTIGGITGAYTVPSPYNTECEWSLVSAVAIGTLASTATFALGSKNSNQPTLSATGLDKFGSVLASGRDNNNALQAYVGALTSTAPMVTYGGDTYMPLPSPASLTAQITAPASTEVLLTVQFRRKLDRPLPERPRQKPHTHTHVTGRRAHRTMMEGFAAQYPEEAVAYHHGGMAEQDTGAMRRGVSPLQQLGPTTVRHRGVNNGR